MSVFDEIIIIFPEPPAPDNRPRQWHCFACRRLLAALTGWARCGCGAQYEVGSEQVSSLEPWTRGWREP